MSVGMSVGLNLAGYILAGGRSTRMGQDKALLPIDGMTLVQRVAAAVGRAAESVTVVGDPKKYSGLGYPVIPDLRLGMGPLAGMETALKHTFSEWNLIAACDLAALPAEMLQAVCFHAVTLGDEIDAVVPRGPDGRVQPLGAVYRKRCVETFSRALDQGALKVRDAVSSLRVEFFPFAAVEVFQNLNTPEAWNQYVNGRTN
jgi:molybdopterin-guanine dinucleotide biosynthesis protein A